MYRGISLFDSSPILELSVKFASQICHENSNKLLDGAYLSDFGIDFKFRCRRKDCKHEGKGNQSCPQNVVQK